MARMDVPYDMGSVLPTLKDYRENLLCRYAKDDRYKKSDLAKYLQLLQNKIKLNRVKFLISDRYSG